MLFLFRPSLCMVFVSFQDFVFVHWKVNKWTDSHVAVPVCVCLECAHCGRGIRFCFLVRFLHPKSPPHRSRVSHHQSAPGHVSQQPTGQCFQQTYGSMFSTDPIECFDPKLEKVISNWHCNLILWAIVWGLLIEQILHWLINIQSIACLHKIEWANFKLLVWYYPPS